MRHTVGGAEGRDPVRRYGVEHLSRIEARLVGNEHGGGGILRRKKAAVGVTPKSGDEMFRCTSPGSSPST